jgi:hypothetical protein
VNRTALDNCISAATPGARTFVEIVTGSKAVELAPASFNWPFLKRRRHLNTWFAFTPCARAISATLAADSTSVARSTASPQPNAASSCVCRRASHLHASCSHTYPPNHPIARWGTRTLTEEISNAPVTATPVATLVTPEHLAKATNRMSICSLRRREQQNGVVAAHFVPLNGSFQFTLAVPLMVRNSWRGQRSVGLNRWKKRLHHRWWWAQWPCWK